MMVAHWMAESLVLALLLGLAAGVLEEVLRRWRLATRWVWGAALLLAALVPFLPLPARKVVAGAAGEVEPLPIGLARGAATMMPSGMEPAALTGMAWGGTALAVLWLLGSASVLLYLLSSQIRLRRMRRGWEVAEVDGVRVWVSEEVGPAAFGIGSGGVVLPRWALGLEGRKRSLTIEHELEHLRGGDVQLWLLALAVLVALPWNPAVWWKLRRLRTAIEVDCDRRVLRRTGEVGLYGKLLIEMAGRRTSVPLAAAALTSRRSEVERRVREMTRAGSRYRVAISGAGSLAAAALILAACQVSRPIEEVVAPAIQTPAAEQAAPDQAAENGGSAPGEAEPSEPTPAVSTPFEVPPLPRTLEPSPGSGARRTPSANPTVGGAAAGTGRGVSSSLETAIGVTGDPEPGDASARELYELAARLAATRTVQAERPVAADTPVVPAAQQTPAQAPALSDQPVFTPMQMRPRMINLEEYRRALEASYPPMLKDAGIGGTATLWVFIDETGRARQVRVYESSGYQQLDRAAEYVMSEVARFQPAENRGSTVPVWVQMNVTFAAR